MHKLVLIVSAAALTLGLAGCGTLGSGGLNLANLPVPIYFLNNGQPVQVDHVGLMLMSAQPAAPAAAK